MYRIPHAFVVRDRVLRPCRRQFVDDKCSLFWLEYSGTVSRIGLKVRVLSNLNVLKVSIVCLRVRYMDEHRRVLDVVGLRVLLHRFKLLFKSLDFDALLYTHGE